MNPDFLSKSPYAEDLIQSIFHAYKHQNYHTSSDFKFRVGRVVGEEHHELMLLFKQTKSMVLIDLWNYNKKFKKYKENFKKLIELIFISYKSASSFLRNKTIFRRLNAKYLINLL